MKKFLLKLVSLIIVCTMVLSIPIKVGAYTDDDWTKEDNSVLEKQNWKFSDALLNANGTEATILNSDSANGKTNDILWFKKAYTFYDGVKYDLYVQIIPRLSSDSTAYSWGNHRVVQGTYKSLATTGGAIETIKINALQINPKVTEFDYEIWLTSASDTPKIEDGAIERNIPIVIGPCWTAHKDSDSKYEAVKIYSDKTTVDGKKIVYTNIFNGDTQGTHYDSSKLGWQNDGGSDNYDTIFYYIAGLGYTSKHKVRGGWHLTKSEIPSEIRVGFDAYVVRFTDDENNTLVDGDSGVGKKDIVEDVPMGYNPIFPSIGIDNDNIKFWTLDQNISYVKDGKTISYTPDDHLTKDQVQELLANITDDDITKYYTEYAEKSSGNNVLVASYKQLELTAHTYYKLDYKNQDNDTVKYPEPPVAETEMIKGESLAGKGNFVVGQTYIGKDGKPYKFGGWYNEAGVTTEIDLGKSSTEKMPGANKTVYAKWTEVIDPVKVEFDMNGHGDGMTTPENQIYSKADSPKAKDPYDIDNTTPKKGEKDSAGYQFLGWYDKDNKEYNFDTASVLTEDIKLTAKWTELIKVDYDLNGDGATGKPADKYIPAGSMPSKVDNPSREGYNFKGWGTTNNSTTAVNTIAVPLDKDTTYYAIWEKKKSSTPTGGGSTGGGGGYTPSSTIPEKKYKVEFETPYGPKPDAQSGIKSGGTVSDPINTLKPGYTTEDGHTFEGWYLDEACTIPYDFNSAVSKDIVLYAKWTNTEPNNVLVETPNAPVVKVEFETEIGETPATQVEVPGNTATDPGAPMDLATLKPGTIINGYRFEGWYLDKDYTIKYNFDTPLTEDIVLYAKWASVGLAKSPKTEDAALPLGVGMASALMLVISLCALKGKRRKDMK